MACIYYEACQRLQERCEEQFDKTLELNCSETCPLYVDGDSYYRYARDFDVDYHLEDVVERMQDKEESLDEALRWVKRLPLMTLGEVIDYEKEQQK